MLADFSWNGSKAIIQMEGEATAAELQALIENAVASVQRAVPEAELRILMALRIRQFLGVTPPGPYAGVIIHPGYPTEADFVLNVDTRTPAIRALYQAKAPQIKSGEEWGWFLSPLAHVDMIKMIGFYAAEGAADRGGFAKLMPDGAVWLCGLPSVVDAEAEQDLDLVNMGQVAIMRRTYAINAGTALYPYGVLVTGWFPGAPALYVVDGRVKPTPSDSLRNRTPAADYTELIRIWQGVGQDK